MDEIIYVEYDKNTMKVIGFFPFKIDGKDYIEITNEKQDELLKLNSSGTLFVKNVDTKEFEAKCEIIDTQVLSLLDRIKALEDAFKAITNVTTTNTTN
jgi:hypothetical protein